MQDCVHTPCPSDWMNTMTAERQTTSREKRRFSGTKTRREWKGKAQRVREFAGVKPACKGLLIASPTSEREGRGGGWGDDASEAGGWRGKKALITALKQRWEKEGREREESSKQTEVRKGWKYASAPPDCKSSAMGRWRWKGGKKKERQRWKEQTTSTKLQVEQNLEQRTSLCA